MCYTYTNTVISVVGAVAFSICFSQSVVQFIPNKTAATVAAAENSKIYTYFLKVCLLIISFFCFGTFLYFHGSKRIEDEFTKYGVKTIATVTAGALYYTSQIDDRSIVCVKFKNKEGEEKTANVDMPPSRFYNYSLDQQVYITYSEMHQNMVRITGDSLPTKGKKWTKVNLPSEELKEQKQLQRIGKLLMTTKIFLKTTAG